MELFAASICAVFISRAYFRGKGLEKGSSNAETLTISAPGKVLVAGGYLVLETPNIGITIAATSRFYSTIRILKSVEQQGKAAGTFMNIIVDSPQFYTRYAYAFSVEMDSLTVLGKEKNEFVEKCLTLTLSFIKQYLGAKKFREIIAATNLGSSNVMGIKIRANNDFYSQIKELKSRELPLRASSLRQLPSFIPCPKDLTGKVEVAKTGMGSSAALTTSLVGALLQWFGVIALPTEQQADSSNSSDTAESRRIVHNLSQLVHANAQGKIGSGFDVAAAVYGTQLYRRFSADTFLDCLDDTVEGPAIFKAVMSKPDDKENTYNNKSGVPFNWNETIIPLSLPPSLDIVMGDVFGGSSSTSMAREVLRWKKEQSAEAGNLWADLSAANTQIYQLLTELNNIAEANTKAYHTSLLWASSRLTDQWSQRKDDAVVVILLELKVNFRKARGLLKRMGDKAGVGIEPNAQSALADATEALPGVLCSGVPGAGGVDAVYALVLSPQAREAVEGMWSQWEHKRAENSSVCALMLSAGTGPAAGINSHMDIDW